MMKTMTTTPDRPPPRKMGLFFLLVGTVLACTILLIIGLLIAALFELILWGSVEEWLGNLFLVAVLLGVVAAAGAAVRVRQYEMLAYVCAAMTAAGVAILIYRTAYEFHLHWSTEELLVSCATTVLTLGIAGVHFAALRFLPFESRLLRAMRMVVFGCAWLVGAMIIMLVWFEDFVGSIVGPWDGWILLLVTIFSCSCVTVGGTIVLPILWLARAGRSRGRSETLGEKPEIAIACPTCGDWQTLAVGLSRCVSCRARISIELEEPRCECGYLLYRLTGDTCPECGREIAGARTCGV